MIKDNPYRQKTGGEERSHLFENAGKRLKRGTSEAAFLLIYEGILIEFLHAILVLNECKKHVLIIRKLD